MIYHTATDKVYFDLFFKRWHQSINRFDPNAGFSLRFVGNEDVDVMNYCRDHNILLTFDNISLDEISIKYNANHTNARGYYALSRWMSIPEHDNVCVSDVDLVQVNRSDIDFSKIFSEYNFASIARKKVKHPNMMMIFYISKDMTKLINQKTKMLLENNPLMWDSDTKLMTWISENYPIYLDFGLFQLDKINLQAIPPFVKFGYFSDKSKDTDLDSWEIKKSKYDTFMENCDEK